MPKTRIIVMPAGAFFKASVDGNPSQSARGGTIERAVASLREKFPRLAGCEVIHA